MGEIADMMLDGTMDPETGEWNFDGEDGPGFPMTGAQAAEFRRATNWSPGDRQLVVERKRRRRYGPNVVRAIARAAVRKALKHVGKSLSDREVDIFVSAAVREARDDPSG